MQIRTGQNKQERKRPRGGPDAKSHILTQDSYQITKPLAIIYVPQACKEKSLNK